MPFIRGRDLEKKPEGIPDFAKFCRVSVGSGQFNLYFGSINVDSFLSKINTVQSGPFSSGAQRVPCTLSDPLRSARPFILRST